MNRLLINIISSLKEKKDLSICVFLKNSQSYLSVELTRWCDENDTEFMNSSGNGWCLSFSLFFFFLSLVSSIINEQSTFSSILVNSDQQGSSGGSVPNLHQAITQTVIRVEPGPEERIDAQRVWAFSFPVHVPVLVLDLVLVLVLLHPIYPIYLIYHFFTKKKAWMYYFTS